jgi:hypothetical protein
LLAGCSDWYHSMSSRNELMPNYSLSVRCGHDCHTIYDQHHGELTLEMKQSIRDFVAATHRRPILLAACTGHQDSAWTKKVAAYINVLGFDVRQVSDVESAKASTLPCVSLLAGKLHVEPPKCRAIGDVSAEKYHEIGCHTAQWRAKSIADPYDLFVASGVQGDQ